MRKIDRNRRNEVELKNPEKIDGMKWKKWN